MSYNPERALWREVLLLQIDDALHGAAGIRDTADRIRAIEDARNLLSKPSPQLDHLCALADIDPDAVVRRIGARIAKAPTPAALAANKKASIETLFKRAKTPKAKIIKYVDRKVTCNGETLTMPQWAERTDLTVAQIATRLRQDWTVERALTQPLGKRNRGLGATGQTVSTDHTACAPRITHAPGVASDFRRVEGTGGGTSAQDRPEISFSPDERVQE